MRTTRAVCVILVLALAAALPVLVAAPTSAQAAADVSASARLVILGTGTPNADPDRSGPALAVVAGGRAYLVDAGPGIVRRAAAARREHGIDALAASGLNRLFITHLHSDHTVGLPDAILSPWVLERPDPIRIFGPPGTASMADHIQEAWKEDVHMRLFGLEPHDYNLDAYKSLVTETTGGPVYEDENVRVTAIPVLHGSWPYPLGYRFEAGGRTIVISGDARPSESLVEACNGCDILVHEVYSAEAFQGTAPRVAERITPAPTRRPWSWPTLPTAPGPACWSCTTSSTGAHPTRICCARSGRPGIRARSSRRRTWRCIRRRACRGLTGERVRVGSACRDSPVPTEHAGVPGFAAETWGGGGTSLHC